MEPVFTETTSTTSGEHHETDCSKVGKILDMIVDGEAGNEEEKYFYKHIEECAPCFERHQQQKFLKGLVQNHISRQRVPVSLINSIKAKIKETV